MIDEEEGPKLPKAAGKGEGDLLLYDFFKHLTSLALLTLGGLLIVIKDVDPKDVKPLMVIIDIAIISLSGILAFSGSSEIVKARYTGAAPGRSIEFLRRAAPGALSIGVGMFLAMFVDSLS
ncbi:MAG TPA: hypothetical protein VF548_17830 [Allosphingosinicella sp.]|jgi:hypothetical protein